MLVVEERVGLRREVRRRDASRASRTTGFACARAAGSDGRPLDQVLIHAERLVELPERLFESAHDRLAFGVVEAGVVHAVEPEHHADRPALVRNVDRSTKPQTARRSLSAPASA